MGVFSALASATLGGSVRRMATGTVLGGLIGGATSDWSAGGVLGGAALGLGAGFMTVRAPAGLYRNAAGEAVGSPMIGTALAGDALRAVPGMAKAGLKAGWGGAKMGWGAAKFAYRHPYAAAGIAGMGMGAYALMPETSSGAPDVEAMGQMATQMGGSTGVLSPIFRDSAEGLVEGLHRGRHS